jgi:hypothetical protein
VLKFDWDPTVGSKVMAILSRYSNLTGQTSSSQSSDLRVTESKQTMDNHVKIFKRNPTVGSKVMALWTRY